MVNSVESETEQSLLSDTLDYHIGELELSLDPANPRRLLPEIFDHDATVLDLGCGIGQTFIASNASESDSKCLIGLDNELEPLLYGASHFENIHYINGTAEQLPLPSATVDLVISRVTLPYTNIPIALEEINRVLKPGGRIWITLHTIRELVNPLLKNFRTIGLKGVLVRSYFLFTGLIFHLSGILLPHPVHGTFESFQTSYRIRRELERHGFKNIEISRGDHFLVTAEKSDSP